MHKMTKVLISLAISLMVNSMVTEAATRIAVIELGSGGTVRRTNTASRLEETSVEGVASFWSALHGYGRKLQHAGMPIVPDLFSRPDSGFVVGLTGSGVDLDHMPTLNGLLTSLQGPQEQENNRVVGHMQVPGSQCKKMLNNVQNTEDYSSDGSLRDAFENQAQVAGISGMHFDVTSSNAADVDSQIASLFNDYSSSKTVVVHLVVEEEDGAARRRNLARRLEGKEERLTENTPQRRLEEEVDEDADADADAQANNNGYYGYGYYNAYGEWVTPYKTMFQIQYFNVVLWTSLGLTTVLFFSIYLMIYMPLMADTLLFGESARVAHDD
jgi:hypothetical protein